MRNTEKSRKQEKFIARACHCCGHCQLTPEEPQRCTKCGKAFLPLNYFHKVHANKSETLKNLFENGEDLAEEDLIKGLYVLW